MRDFHFTTEQEQAEIEKILQQRKKKQTKQQMLFMDKIQEILLIEDVHALHLDQVLTLYMVEILMVL